MRIFLSHKQEDELQARRIAAYLEFRRVPYYLDVLDDNIVSDPGRLTAHLQRQVRESSHLMAIVSQKTRLSWWVPFEIGLAAECGNPISTFLLENVQPPEFLMVWPFLRTPSDLDQYVSLLATRHHLSEGYMEKRAWDRRTEAAEFHRVLKQRLGQYWP